MLPRHIVHYLITVALLTLYGSQVCPFLDTLTVRQVLIPTSIAFAVIGVVRHFGIQRITQQPLKKQSSRQFQLDLTLYLSAGVGLMIYNSLMHGFPLESGLKVVLGTLVTGFMASCDLALRREYYMANQGLQFQPDENPFPLSHKFAWFASITLLTVLATVFLVVTKDLEWLATDGAAIDHKLAQRYILAELGFVIAVFLSYALNVTYTYAGNLKLMLAEENRVLERVAPWPSGSTGAGCQQR